MDKADPVHLWTHLMDALNRAPERAGDAVPPEVVAHEDSDLHQVFCDEHFCLEKIAVED